MPLSQMGAVMNRKLRPNYIDAINAQTPYLPQLYQQRSADAYNEKLYNQSERSMAQTADIARRNEAFAQDQLDQQKKQAKTARNLGYANIGLGAATGLADLYQASQPLKDSVLPELSDIAGSGMFGVDSPAAGFQLDSEPLSMFGTDSPAAGFQLGGGDGVWDTVTDVATDIFNPLKQIGGAVWDAGSSFLDEIGGLFI